MPAGIDTNDRTSGVRRPSSTAQSPQRAEPGLGPVEPPLVEMEPAPVPFEVGPAAAGADLHPITEPIR